MTSCLKRIVPHHSWARVQEFSPPVFPGREKSAIYNQTQQWDSEFPRNVDMMSVRR